MSLVELLTRNMVTGTSRLFYSLTLTILVGFGLDSGAAVVAFVLNVPKIPPLTDEDGDGSYDGVCKPFSHSVKYILLFFPGALALILNLNSHYKQIPIIMLTATIAFLITDAWTSYLTPQLASALASFTSCVISNIYAKYRGVPAIIPTLSALRVLVPGGLAVKSISDLANSNVSSGLVLAGRVFSVALSIGLGMFLAVMVTTPTEWSSYIKKRFRLIDDVGVAAENLEPLHF
jgi:uncharacterized membrane protein YjjB (DUF3815 family)